jgi:hypothetical protein
LPIPLRLLLAAQPKLVTPMLQVVHRAITRFLLDQAGLKAEQVDSGAVTLIQRFGSAANLNIHLHCLVLDSSAADALRPQFPIQPAFQSAPCAVPNGRFAIFSMSTPGSTHRRLSLHTGLRSSAIDPLQRQPGA